MIDLPTFGQREKQASWKMIQTQYDTNSLDENHMQNKSNMAYWQL